LSETQTGAAGAYGACRADEVEDGVDDKRPRPDPGEQDRDETGTDWSQHQAVMLLRVDDTVTEHHQLGDRQRGAQSVPIVGVDAD